MAAAEESKVRQDSAALVVEETKMTPIRISQNPCMISKTLVFFLKINRNNVLEMTINLKKLK